MEEGFWKYTCQTRAKYNCNWPQNYVKDILSFEIRPQTTSAEIWVKWGEDFGFHFQYDEMLLEDFKQGSDRLVYIKKTKVMNSTENGLWEVKSRESGSPVKKLLWSCRWKAMIAASEGSGEG